MVRAQGLPQVMVALVSDMMFFCWVIPSGILGYFLNLCLRLKKEGPETRTVSSRPCLALIGGANQQGRRHEALEIEFLQYQKKNHIKVRIVNMIKNHLKQLCC